MERFRALLGKVATGAQLSRDEAAHAFDKMMSGEATPAQMGGFLMGLRIRGETVDEITGAVATMRGKMLTVEAPADAIDVVGTGGDAAGSYNISTCAAFIVAGAGVPVAKHGNRALSSKSGAADVLAALGSERAWVVHGSDGLDEVTTSGATFVAELDRGKVKTFEIAPEEAGLKRVKPEELKGGEPALNAMALKAVLDGMPGPFHDVALMNAAAALVVAGKAKTIADGAKLAAKSVDSGAAKERLKKLIAISNAKS